MQKNLKNMKKSNLTPGDQPSQLSQILIELNKKLESENLPTMELKMKNPLIKPESIIEATFLKNSKK